MRTIQRNILVRLDSAYSTIQIRIRWNKRKQELELSLGFKWDPAKWDTARQRPANNTIVNGVTARHATSMINEMLEKIDSAFRLFEAKNKIPSPSDLKAELKKTEEKPVCKTLGELCKDYVKTQSIKKQWSRTVKYAYPRVIENLEECNKGLTFDSLSEVHLVTLLKDYLGKGRQNKYILKEFTNLRTFLTYLDKNVGKVDRKVLEFDPSLKTVKKTVTYLTQDELNQFYTYDFGKGETRLSEIRDMFCFMANTSLRYSDMQNLKHSDIEDEHLNVIIQKTTESVRIPLTDMAKEIIGKYPSQKDDSCYVFPRISNQKMNDYLKEAAEIVGLDREFVETGISGNTKSPKKVKLYETISCHDARRTFVTIGLSLGMEPNFIMRCTGHQDYDSMKPYISITEKATDNAMKAWNKVYTSQTSTPSSSPTTDEATSILNSLPEDKRQMALLMLKGLAG